MAPASHVSQSSRRLGRSEATHDFPKWRPRGGGRGDWEGDEKGKGGEGLVLEDGEGPLGLCKVPPPTKNEGGGEGVVNTGGPLLAVRLFLPCTEPTAAEDMAEKVAAFALRLRGTPPAVVIEEREDWTPDAAIDEGK